MKKIFMGIFSGLLCCSVTCAQVPVKGKVIDAFTKEALPGVNLRLINTTTGTNSNADGSFVLTANSPTDSISISFVGYRNRKIPIGQKQLLIQLYPQSSALNQVIVSASREGQARTEAPIAISTITKQVLTETKAVTLDQVLNKVSGVYMVNLGNEQHTMAIRQPIGYRSLFLYLEDGIPIRTTGDFNHNALIEINMAALKTMEIIRGPSSSLYGSEAIGGAINFITQPPSQILTAKLQAETSNQGYKRTDFAVSNTFGKLGLYAGGYYATQRDGIISHSDYNKLAFTLRGDYAINSKSKFITTASLIDYHTDQTGGLDSTKFYGKKYESLQTFTYRKVNALRIRSTLEHQWNAANNTTLNVFFRRNAIKQNPFYAIRNIAQNPLKAAGEINTDAFKSYGLIAQHKKNFHFLDARLIGGLSLDQSPATYEAHYINIDRNQAGVYTGYTPTDSLLTNYAVNLLNTAAYGQLEISPLPKAKLVAALRYDRLDYNFDNHITPNAFTGAPDEQNNFTSLSPKLGATYSLNSQLGTYANYSVGFAPPQITDLYRGVKVPTLKPTTYANYEAGGWLSFNQSKGYLDVSIYQLNGVNEIISVRLPDGSYQNQNAGKTKHQGVEYTLKYAPHKSLNLRVSGTNARHVFTDYIERGTNYNQNEMATAPRFISNSEVTYKPAFLPGLRLGLEWQHLGKYYMDAANSEYYEGYDLFNFRTGYTLKGFEVWVNALNLTDKLYATTVDKFAYGKSYRQGIPRTFNVGLAYNFSAKAPE
ncbi:TonB-dependent receptor [Adhaeribacter rhizoryzae]|uniref:TonB-dependent receptor n=1 Tax=Adhaeribacter rhizoryzae TaxID=2607907 RepID=A0A5M6DIS4_9BACT|nr:TonB-dependent receptor [Adhaeribacter rhizoryzae]KAA5547477.1 TonB-dependent receptor [Adhaeribacter rhizoryzae]